MNILIELRKLRDPLCVSLYIPPIASLKIPDIFLLCSKCAPPLLSPPHCTPSCNVSKYAYVCPHALRAALSSLMPLFVCRLYPLTSTQCASCFLCVLTSPFRYNSLKWSETGRIAIFYVIPKREMVQRFLVHNTNINALSRKRFRDQESIDFFLLPTIFPHFFV